MRSKLTAKVHRHSKSTGGTRSQSIEKDNFIYNRTDSEKRESELYAPNHSAHFIKLEDLSGDSENEVLPSIKRESTSSNGSPRKRKVRVRTQSQTPTNGISRLHVSKETSKLFKEKAFESLLNEVPPSIKREPSFEDSLKIKKPETLPGRKTSATEIFSNFTTSLQNKENEVFPSKKKKDPSLSKSSAKLDTESRRQSFSTSKTPLKKQWTPLRTPPTTPYALNRPQRNRIPPLAYWRGEHRSFRTLVNGDIVLIDVHIPEYTEEPQRKRRKLSEKKNSKVIKTELYDED